ncbi:MAG: glutathione S-transferase [Methylophilaceae bacterium]|nr:glutathione S-transferase [Methylophilaceae bacterium]
MQRPILYSYRRCPYAMRARMALSYAGIQVEIREIALREKPAHMLAVSPKGTVPVLVLASNEVLEQSLDIMDWALQQSDVDEWIIQDQAGQKLTADLIATNDGAFKKSLDKYKYAIRFPENPPEIYRAQGEEFLQRLEILLQQNTYLCRNTISKADVAIFPFVRQFSMVDENWFERADYPSLKAWLNGLLNSQLFLGVMQKYPVWAD